MVVLWPPAAAPSLRSIDPGGGIIVLNPPRAKIGFNAGQCHFALLTQQKHGCRAHDSDCQAEGRRTLARDGAGGVVIRLAGQSGASHCSSTRCVRRASDPERTTAPQLGRRQRLNAQHPSAARKTAAAPEGIHAGSMLASLVARAALHLFTASQSTVIDLLTFFGTSGCTP